MRCARSTPGRLTSRRSPRTPHAVRAGGDADRLAAEKEEQEMARRAFENRSADGAEFVRRLDSDDDDDDGDGAKRRKTNRGGLGGFGSAALGAAAATATLASVVPASKPRPRVSAETRGGEETTPTTNASNASNASKRTAKTTATKAREGRATGSVYSAGTARTVDDGRFSVVCTELLTTTRVCVFQTVPSYASFTRARARPGAPRRRRRKSRPFPRRLSAYPRATDRNPRTQSTPARCPPSRPGSTPPRRGA